MDSEQTKNPPGDQPVSRHGRDLTTGSIPRHLLAFSLPMLAGNVLQTAYSLVNAVWVGKFLGTSAMAAVTVSFPVMFVLMAVAGGLTMGTNIVVAQSVGARNFEQAKRGINNSVVLSAALSAVLLGVGVAYSRPLLRAIDTPPDVLPLAAHYMRLLLLGLPSMFGMFLFGAVLRAVGDSATPLYFQTFSVCLTAALDPLLMFGLLGLPRMGLNGTAAATVASQTLALVALLFYLARKGHMVNPDWRHLSADWPTSWLIVKIGFPVMIQQSLISMAMVLVIGFVNAFGENTVAAFGAASRIDQIAFLPAMTIGMAVSTMTGQNIGARRTDRVSKVFLSGLALAGCFTAVGSLLAVGAPGLLLRMFLSDPQVISLGVHYLRIVGACYMFFAVMFVATGIINGAGQTLVSTVTTLISLWGVRVPLAAYLPKVVHSVNGIWYAIALGFASSMVMSVLYYWSGLWRRAAIARVGPVLPPPNEPETPEPEVPVPPSPDALGPLG